MSRLQGLAALLLIVSTGFAPLDAAENFAADPILKLSEIIVPAPLDLLPPESWRYAELEGFEILSDESDRRTEQLVREFWRFNQALSIAWPGLQPRSVVPVSLIFCGRHNTFDAFVPAAAVGGDYDTGLASLYLKDDERSAIVIDLASKVLNITDAAALDPASARTGANMEGFRVDHDQQLSREYVHFLLSRTQPRCPAWLEEGLAQLIMGMKFDRNSISFAKLEDPNQQSVEAHQASVVAKAERSLGSEGLPPPPSVPAEDRGFQATLQNARIMGMDEMFAVARDSETAHKPLGSFWAKQCYAFVHLCLYGRHPQRQKEFITFLERGAEVPMSEALFEECFKMSYRQMEIELRNYINDADYKSIEWKAPRGLPEPPRIDFREANPAEIGYIKGEALRIAGHSDLAEKTFVAPYVRGERDPRLLASLGLSELAAGRNARAEQFLSAATSAKVARPRAYLGLARLKFDAGLAKPATRDQLSAGQVDGVLRPLFIARSQIPPLPEVYVLIAETWIHSAVKPTADNLKVLIEGVRLFPRVSELLYPTAKLYANAGLTGTADSLAKQGLRFAEDETTKSKFAALAASLSSVVTPPGYSED
ncbi:MAG: hypothetical protein ABIZ04_17955 [Opitutus sp.]